MKLTILCAILFACLATALSLAETRQNHSGLGINKPKDDNAVSAFGRSDIRQRTDFK